MSRFLISICLSLLWLPTLSGASPDRKTPEMRVECRLRNSVVYERQPFTFVVTLVSSTPDVAFANVVRAPELNKGVFTSINKVDRPGAAYEEVAGGKTFYCFPLEAYVVTMAEKGNFQLAGGEYSIGVSYPTVVNDPFWGPVRTSEVKKFLVSVEKCRFKVKSLPSPPSDVHFSGSVGQFSIETIVPRGDIVVNEEATAFVVLRGKGMIAEATMPEYRDAFKSQVKLKSVSESRSSALENGELVTELTLECTFIPTAREDARIDEIIFGYFDPVDGKYKTAKSKPVEIVVKSSTSKRDSMSI